MILKVRYGQIQTLSFVYQQPAEIVALREEVSSLQQTVDKQKKEFESARKELSKSSVKKSEFIEVERDVVDLQQYIRRNNIEISGIPNSVEKLEEKVISIGKAVNINIKQTDIEACHRLKQKDGEEGPKKTIVRFVNRKLCERLLSASKKFKQHSVYSKAGLKNVIYINNNLCGYNKFLWGKTKYLYQKKSINKFWVFNGVINVLIAENDSPIKITHLNDLIELFPNDVNLRKTKFNN